MNKQAANVIELLEYFGERQQPATLADIARHFGWPRSSTFKLLGTLKARGYLYEPVPKAGYYPAPLLAEHVNRIEQAQPVSSDLRTLLEELAVITGETVVLAAASDSHAVFVATVESPHSVRYAAPVGKRVPLYATATGRALLSQMKASTRQALLRKTNFEAYTEITPMSAAEVEEDIRVSLERGWFHGNASFTPDLGGVAVALPLQGRCFALLVAGPMYRVNPQLEQLAKTLMEHAGAYLKKKGLG